MVDKKCPECKEEMDKHIHYHCDSCDSDYLDVNETMIEFIKKLEDAS